MGLGPAAETFLRTAAAADTLRLEHELREIAELEAVWGREISSWPNRQHENKIAGFPR